MSNPTDQPLTVDALRREGKRVLKESLVILCQGQAYTAPGSVGLLRPTQPVVLKPGETISTVTNALELQGQLAARRYRIEFQFCLGQHGSKQSFYYMARHHDVIRASLGSGQLATLPRAVRRGFINLVDGFQHGDHALGRVAALAALVRAAHPVAQQGDHRLAAVSGCVVRR